LLAFLVETTVGVPYLFRIHYNPGSTVKITDAAADCTASASTGAIVSRVIERDAGAFDIEVLAFKTGEFTLCADGVHLANVRAAPAPCLFADTDLSPCFHDQCTDPKNETCMQYTAEYCIMDPADPGCALFVPYFLRTVGSAEIEFHATFAAVGTGSVQARLLNGYGYGYGYGDTTEVEASKTYSATYSACLGSCATCSPGALVKSEFEEDTLLRLQLEFSTDGVFEICAAGEVVARVEASHALCAGLVGGICQGVCATDPSSEACQRIVLDACAYASASTDPACALFFPIFERSAGEATVAVYTDSSSVAVVSAWCGCSCADTDGIVKIVQAFRVGKELSVTFLTTTRSRYHICAGNTALVEVRVVEPACPFTDLDASPCVVDACVGNAASEACLQATSSYCAQHSTDPGCALFVPLFYRAANVDVNVSLHLKEVTGVNRSSLRGLNFTIGGADCNEDVPVVLQAVEVAGELTTVSMKALINVESVLCLAGEAVASVSFSTRTPPCAVSAGGPCADAICADPTSEPCLRAFAEHCANSGDTACDLVGLPVYERAVGVAADLALHSPQSAATAELVESSDCADEPSAIFLAELKGGALRVTGLKPLAHGRATLCVGGKAVAKVDPVAPCAFPLSAAPCAAATCLEDPSGDACQQVAAEYCFANPTLDACAVLLPRFERPAGNSTIDVHIAATKTNAANTTFFASDTNTTLFASDAECDRAQATPRACSCPSPASVTVHPEKLLLNAPVGEYFLCDGDTPVLAVDVVAVPVFCIGDAFDMVCDLCAADPQSDTCLKAFASACAGSADPACELVVPVFERTAGEQATVSFHQTAAKDLVVARCDPVISGTCPGEVPELVTYDEATKLVTVTFYPPAENRVYLVADGAVVAIVDVLKPKCQDVEAAVCKACADGHSDVCDQSMAEYCFHTNSSACDLLLVKFVRNVGDSEIVVHAGDLAIVEASCGCNNNCTSPVWVNYTIEMGAEDTKILKLTTKQVGLLTACEGNTSVPAFDVDIISTSAPCLFVAGGFCAQEACTDPASEECLKFLGIYCIDGVDKACDLIMPRYERTAGVVSTIPIYNASGDVSVVRHNCSCADDCPAATVVTPTANPQGGFFDASILFHEGGAGKFQAAVCVAGEKVAVVDVIVSSASCFLGAERPCDACAANPYSDLCQQVMAEYCASPASDADACELLLLHFERVVNETAPLVLHAKDPTGDVRAVVRDCGCNATCGSTLASVWTRQEGRDEKDNLVTLDILFGAAGQVEICVGEEAVALVTAVVRNPACVFSADGAPCTAAACAVDPSSEVCQQIMAEYCATDSTQDQACDLIMPLFERSVGKNNFSLHIPTTTSKVNCTTNATSNVTIECTTATQSAIVLSANTGCADQLVVSEFVAFDPASDRYNIEVNLPYAAEFLLCAAGVKVAKVWASAVCGTVEADAPCSLCSDLSDPACVQLTTAYCASQGTREEGPCKLLTFNFERVITDVVELDVFTGSVTNVVVATPGCGCSASCASRTVDVLRADYVSAIYTLRLALRAFGQGLVDICGDGTVRATLRLSQGGICNYAVASPNPCDLEECRTAPESETCMQFTQEYCASNPEDKGCETIPRLFHRVLGVPAEVFVHVAGLEAVSSARPLETTVSLSQCACTDACAVTADFDYADELLVVRATPMVVGRLYVCVNGATEALIDVEAPPCTADTLTPCTAASCEDPKSDECQQLLSEYCMTHDDDACTYVAITFRRELKETSKLTLAVTKGTAREAIFFVPSKAACDSSNAEGIVVNSLEIEAETGLLEAEIYPLFIGTFKVCSDEKEVAFIVVEAQDGCSFVTQEASPCSTEICTDDPFSESCQQYTAEFCFSHPTDQGCSFLLLNFARTVEEVTTVTVHTSEDADIADVFAVGRSCGSCSCSKSEGAKVTAGQVMSGEAVTFSLIPELVGSYLVCAGSSVVFGLDVVPSPGTFAALVCSEWDSAVTDAQYVAEYCVEHPEDSGCAFWIPSFERQAGIEQEISIYVSEADVDRPVSFVDASCACPTTVGTFTIFLSDCTSTADNVKAAVDSAVSRINVNFTILGDATTVKFCLGSTHVANVQLVRTCPFETSDETSPCHADVCADPASEWCAQYVSAYCALHAAPGCDEFVPAFSRVVGTATEIEFHASSGEITVADAAAGCGTVSPRVGVEAAIFLGGRLAVKLLPMVVGEYHVCIDGAVQAKLDVSPAACAFVASPDSPCSAPECSVDPSSDACMLYTAEYCKESVNDGACQLFVPRFARPSLERTNVTLHASSAFGTVSIASSSATCGTTAREAVLYQTHFDDATQTLSVEFELKVALATVKICGDDFHVATVSAQASCASELDEHPCKSPACVDPESELCAAFTAEYCSQHATDTACALWIPRFERIESEATTIELHVGDLAELSPEVFVVDSRCDCTCSDAGLVAVSSIRPATERGALSVGVLPARIGEGIICVGREAGLATAVAKLGIVPSSCLFAYGDASPCTRSECADPSSDACLQATLEYCTTTEDSACALVLPRFERPGFAEAELEVHVPGTKPVVGLTFVPPGVGCGAAAVPSQVRVLLSTFNTGTRYATVTADVQTGYGAYTLCAAGEAVAVLDVTHTCPFTVEEESPCTASVCEDLLSEECQAFVSEYCFSHPADGACELLAPAFVRTVGMATSVMLPVASGTVEATFVPRECGCGCADLGATAAVDNDVMTVRFTPRAIGSFSICSGGSLLAYVDVEQDACDFTKDSSPCTADVCADLDSEECQLMLAEYCQEHALDGACALVVPYFKRPALEAFTLTLHGAADFVSATLIADSCSCGDDCAAKALILKAGDYVSDVGKLTFQELNVGAAGKWKICGSKASSDDATAHSVLLAVVETSKSGCPFEVQEGNPCSVPLCEDLESNECQTYAAEYCAEHTADPGCAFFVPFFRKAVGTMQVEIHTTAADLETAAVADASCGCSCASVAPVAVTALAQRASGVLDLSLDANAVGTYHICVGMRLRGGGGALLGLRERPGVRCVSGGHGRVLRAAPARRGLHVLLPALRRRGRRGDDDFFRRSERQRRDRAEGLRV
jgi:hypothetical protein